MSGSEQYEKVTVSSDGVTADKRFEEDEFPVPAIAFEIQSSRSETVTVVLVDEVPDDVAVEDLGFHPEYGSEYWSIDESQITFEREIEAGSEYTTVYGIRATGTDDVQQFLTQPRIESIDPPLSESDNTVISEGSSDVVRDVISGGGNVPGLEDDEDSGEDVETLNLKDPNDPDDEGAPSGSGSSSSDEGPSDSGFGGSGGVDSVVSALAAELRNGAVDEDDVKLLRKALDVADDGNSGSVDARIQRLQTEMSDLLAYTDALEEFLDDNGTAEAMIEDFRGDVEDLQGELSEVGELARSHEGTLSKIQSTVDGVESLESEMSQVLEDVDAVQTNVEGSVNEVKNTVSGVESSVDEFESELDSLESQIGDIDVEDVRDDIDTIEDEINELKEWREQLSSVIGGGN